MLKKATISSSALASPVKENQDNLSSSVSKFPQIYVPKLPLNSVCSQAGTRNKINQMRQAREEIKNNIARFSSVPRPRAVLSSPENDEIIGNKNKFITKRPPSGTKTSSLDRNTPAVAKESYSKSGLKQRIPLRSTVPTHKASAREGKPSPSCKGV